MIDKKIEELIEEIKESPVYQKYLILTNHLNEDDEIKKEIEEIKSLQKKATLLEYQKDKKYIKIDEEIKERLIKLNENYLYSEYSNSVSELNEILTSVKNILEKYINEKI